MTAPKITPALRERARALRSSGLTADQVAAELGLSRRSVYRALGGATPSPPPEVPDGPSRRLPAAKAPPGDAPADTLRGRAMRLQAALERARTRTPLESPISARLTSDLVDVRLLIARIDRTVPSGPVFTYDDIDRARRNLAEKVNATLAGVKLECAACTRALVVEPIPIPAPVWRPKQATDGGAAEMSDNLAAEIDELAAEIDGIQDPSVAAKYLRQTGRLLNLAGRLERNRSADGFEYAAAAVEAFGAMQETARIYAARPLLCAECSRAAQLRIGMGDDS